MLFYYQAKPLHHSRLSTLITISNQAVKVVRPDQTIFISMGFRGLRIQPHSLKWHLPVVGRNCLKFEVWGLVQGSGFWVLSKWDCRVALDRFNAPRNDKRGELILIFPSVPVFAFSYAVASCVPRSVYCISRHQTLLFGLWSLDLGLWAALQSAAPYRPLPRR